MYKVGSLYNSPFDHIEHPNFLTKNQIDYTLKNIENLPYEKGTTEEKGIRESRIKWIPLNKTFNKLYTTVLELVHISNSYNWKFDLKELTFPFQYTEYHSTNNGRYDWHVDVGENKRSYRKLSLTIQLSHPSEYEGGDFQLFGGNQKEKSTNFPYTTMQKGLGTIIIFPSYMVHRVTPVTKGIRKSLVLWVGGCTFT